MLEVNDVCLLQPAGPNTGFQLDVSSRPAVGEERKAAAILAGIQRLRAPADASVAALFQKQVFPALRWEGVTVESIFVTESAPNTFTRLPVREGEHLLVWFGTLEGGQMPSAQRLQEASAALGPHSDAPVEILELDPTPRSLLGHHQASP